MDTEDQVLHVADGNAIVVGITDNLVFDSFQPFILLSTEFEVRRKGPDGP
jgi:hypothetical protein